MPRTEDDLNEFFAVDLDGNLDRPDEECRSLLRQLRAEGLKRVAIATAHPMNGIRVRGLGVFYEVDHLVLENGSVLLERDGQSWREVEAWKERNRATRPNVERLRDELLRRAEIVERRWVDYTSPPMELRTLRLPGVDGPLTFEDGAGAFQLTSKDVNVVAQARGMMGSLMAQLGFRVNEIEDVYTLTYGLGSKGEGVDFVAHLDGRKLRMVAMGDSRNDLDMLSRCDLPCAPGNARPEVKQLVQSRNGIVATAERIEGVKEVLRLLRQAAHSVPGSPP